MNDGYYLMIDAKKLWLADNPSKTDREFFREGVNVQDEYTENAGGKKVRVSWSRCLAMGETCIINE